MAGRTIPDFENVKTDRGSRMKTLRHPPSSRTLPFKIHHSKFKINLPPMSHSHWPRFWPDVPEEDRPVIREILAELLGRGTLVGASGAGRDQFLLARDHYRERLSDYLAPLGLELIVDDDFSILQARPRPEACH